MDALKIYGIINALKVISVRDSVDQELMDRALTELTDEVKRAAGTIGSWIADAIESIVEDLTYSGYECREDIEKIVYKLDYPTLLEWGDKRMYSEMLEEYDNEAGFRGESHKDFVKMFAEDPTIGEELKGYLAGVEEDIHDDDDFFNYS